MTSPRTIILRASGLRFSALCSGEGPVVLCLHGFPDHKNSYRHQLPVLASAGYRAIAPTLRGYEPSAQPVDGDYHVVRMAEDVVDWIDDLGQERVHLVGHDWGAIISYAAAALAPERFHSLTTLAIPHLGSLRRYRALLKLPQQLRKSWYIACFQLPWIAEYVLSRRNGDFVDRLWRDWSPGWVPPADEMAAVKRSLAAPGVTRAALAYYRSLEGWSAASHATRALQKTRIPVPTLAVTGAQDGCMDTRLYDIAMHASDFPGGLVVERIEGAGHFVHQECPDKVNQLLLDWLHRHTPKPTP